MQELDAPVVYPVHPRNRETVFEIAESKDYGNILFVEPVGYLESIWLVNSALQVITDSGGLQREAFFAGKKCTTLLDFEVWPETMIDNRNILASPDKDSILSAMGKQQSIDKSYQPFGSGKASSTIVEALLKYLEKGAIK